MGIFYKLVKVINRAPVDLTVTFDGQTKTLTPGENFLPAITVPFAKNQNPIMGSGDPHNPHISGARYLIAAVDGPEPDPEDECQLLTDAEWQEHLGRPSRDDEQIAFQDRYGNDPKARLIVQGKGKRTPAKSRYEAGGTPKGTASFENDKA